MTGKPYSELTPEQVEKEKKRKRLDYRRKWVEKWYTRIREEIKNEEDDS